MRIAILDYETVRTNPYGNVHLRLIDKFCDEHDFTVYSVTFDNPRPDSVRWVRVPAPRRPLALMFFAFHLFVAVLMLRDRLWKRQRYDIVQSVEANAFGANLIESQFCHRAFLRDHWATSHPTGWRRWVRWVFEAAAAVVEPWVLRRADLVTCPSNGTERDIVATYPFLDGKTTVIHNPVEVAAQRSPSDFDVAGFRRQHELPIDRVLLVFVALGHYERKGLPVILDALADGASDEAHLVVIGGYPDLVERYETIAQRRGIAGRVDFLGMQPDVRPFLWASDAFVFPSSYEAFAFVILEAAASGLPLIVTRLHGAEEFVESGRNGVVVDRDAPSVRKAIDHIVHIGADGRAELGAKAMADVQAFNASRFLEGWRRLYESFPTPQARG